MLGSLALACVALSLPTSARAVDVSVTNIEVTQGSQMPSNGVPLIARRGTAFRVSVASAFEPADRAASLPVSVTGRLHVFRDGVEITPGAGVAPIASVQVNPFAFISGPVGPTAELVFELLAPTAIIESDDVDVRVDLTPVSPEARVDNNTGRVDDLTFEARAAPRLRYVRVDYLPAGDGPPERRLVRPGVGDAFVRGILPVNDAAVGLYQRLPGGIHPFAVDLDFDQEIDASANSEASLLSLGLANRRLLTVEAGLGASDRTFIYGFLRNSPMDGFFGASLDGSRIAFGNTQPDRYQGTYAHELLHNFGVPHASAAVNGRDGFDVGSRLGENPVDNGVPAGERLKPGGSTARLMFAASGALTAERWISQSLGYLSLVHSATLAPRGRRISEHTVPGKTSHAAPQTRRGLVAVHGVMNRKGDRVQRLEPTFRYPWRSQPTTVPDEAPYTLVVQSEKGRTRTRFSAKVSFQGRGDENGAFEVIIPAGPGIRSIRVLDRRGRVILDRRDAGDSPKVTLSPIPARALRGGKATLRWDATDPDTPRRNLRYQVAYSPDGGRNFAPVATTTAQSAVTFDVAPLPRTKGRRGLFRVFASDGLHSSFSDLTRVAVPGARGLD